MALSPGIPTSFVPRQSVPGQQRGRSSGSNLFLMLSLFLAGLALIAAIGTFAYDKYLQHVLATKSQQLAVAEREVDTNQVEEFVRLRDRLVNGRGLLQNHIALSQVFDVFESQTLATVRFSSLNLTVADDHTAQLDISGTARNFNALAAQSNAFAAEKRIKRAIFSGIVVNKDNSVNFRLTADLDSKLLLISSATAAAAPAPSTLTVPVPVATTTPSIAPVVTVPSSAPATTAPATTTKPKP